MLKFRTFMFAAMATLFSLTAYGADPATDQNDSQTPAPAAEGVTDPVKMLHARITNDTMGYLFADVQNPTQMTMANVFVVVYHLDEKTGKPDHQTSPMLIAKQLPPGVTARLKLKGQQVFSQADFNLYRVVVVRAEPILR